MKTLGFARLSCNVEGRRIRPSVFESRSTLPVSAACLVANAARQTLSDLFGVPVSLKLLEPVLPDRAGWSSIGSQALVFAIRGAQSDAAIVLRAQDALALVCAALGEGAGGPRGLSTIENELAARMASALCGALAPVCGMRGAGPIDRAKALEGYLTYFELILDEPVQARIGIALAREPQPQVAPGLAAAGVHDIDVRLSVEIAYGFLPAASIASLRAGDVVRLDSALGDPARLLAAGAVVARGQCGHVGARRALAVQ
jgi:flagellar motor switch/type III secretory pathway protein FliN